MLKKKSLELIVLKYFVEMCLKVQASSICALSDILNERFEVYKK